MRGWYAFVCMVNAATRGGGLVWLRRDRRAQVGGRTSGQVGFLLVFAVHGGQRVVFSAFAPQKLGCADGFHLAHADIPVHQHLTRMK